MKKVARSAAHAITGLLRNSLPLSKSSPLTSKGTASTPARSAFTLGYRTPAAVPVPGEDDEDVDVGVVVHRARHDPAGVHVGQVQRAGELALQRRPAVRHGFALEEPRLGLDLVAGPAQGDRGAQ